MRHKNVEWDLPGPKVNTCEQVGIAVLMDLRDELQTLNRIFGCHNFIGIPSILRDIRRNTTKKKRVKVAKSARNKHSRKHNSPKKKKVKR